MNLNNVIRVKIMRYMVPYCVKPDYSENNEYCCQVFKLLLNTQRLKIFYSAEMRYYTLATVAYSGYQRLYYCFCCG